MRGFRVGGLGVWCRATFRTALGLVLSGFTRWFFDSLFSEIREFP